MYEATTWCKVQTKQGHNTDVQHRITANQEVLRNQEPRAVAQKQYIVNHEIIYYAFQLF